MPDRVESFRKVDRYENCLIAQLEFVKPIQNGLRKVKNLIKSIPSRELAWWGEQMELDSRMKSRRDRMMHSNNFEMQELRETGQKEAREWKGFPILWMEIGDAFQMEGNEYEGQERLKMCRGKSVPEQGRCFSMG